MMTKKFAAAIAATLAFAAAPAMAKTTAEKAPGQSLFKKTSLNSFRPSPINLDHEFREVPNTTITLKACTSDRHDAIIRGVIMVDTTELDAQGKDANNLVKPFGFALQTAYADNMKLIASNELKQDTFMPGFLGFSDVFKSVSIDSKEKEKVTLVFMPRRTEIGAVSLFCPKPKN
jgi:hypothetical protein